ncbi:MAG TPA: OmpA family protein [Polaromonas sp.]|uniref:OmpA family protein n=1 Tax=Polaromonas sp. TaxID=1869339 RepID=UPI002D39EC54|nr:OmpA family protein [Polaromonas sp.]HYW56069.1 OmpA family protein [Polaromonas sp.]
MSPSEDDQLGLVLGLVFAIAATVVSLVIGVALARPGDAITELPVPASAVVLPAVVVAPPAPAVSSPDAQAVSDAASITVEYGVVKLYFASGKTELAPGAGGALGDVVIGARSGKKVLISGFHDSKGNAAINAGMAKRRALAVRDALIEAGVPGSQITLENAAVTAGTGNDEEARRVEISLK